MDQDHKNLGVLERWFAIRWAIVKTYIYATFHTNCRPFIKQHYKQQRGSPEQTSELLVFIDEEPYEPVIDFVGVVRGYEFDDTFKVLRTYYGDIGESAYFRAHAYAQAHARCNFCNGPMPCDCKPPDDFDEWFEEDMRARNKVDMPHEDER